MKTRRFFLPNSSPDHPDNKDLTMPIILWILGVPISLILVLWLFGVVHF